MDHLSQDAGKWRGGWVLCRPLPQIRAEIGILPGKFYRAIRPGAIENPRMLW